MFFSVTICISCCLVVNIIIVIIIILSFFLIPQSHGTVRSGNSPVVMANVCQSSTDVISMMTVETTVMRPAVPWVVWQHSYLCISSKGSVDTCMPGMTT